MVMSIPMVATAVPKIPPFGHIGEPPACRASALAKRAMAMVMAVTAVVSKPTATPEMMFVAGPVLLASAISFTGRQSPAV